MIIIITTSILCKDLKRGGLSEILIYTTEFPKHPAVVTCEGLHRASLSGDRNMRSSTTRCINQTVGLLKKEHFQGVLEAMWHASFQILDNVLLLHSNLVKLLFF